MRRLVAFNICLLIVAGCDSVQSSSRLREAARRPAAQATARRDASLAQQVEARLANFQQVANVPRKIIYEAEVSLVVGDVSKTEAEINALIKQFSGYVAEAAVDRRQGEELSGRWRVRIPVEHFETFVDAVSKLGVAESRNQTAQDVTEEFVDLEAQISNKKRLEERIVKLLADSSGPIKDVIEVERELGRVRGEIEQLEGRVNYLTNRTELTTVTITAREEKNYVPPAAPSFTNRIRLAWTDSLQSLRDFGEQAAVSIVYAFPWVVALAVLLIPVSWYVSRRAAARRKRAAKL